VRRSRLANEKAIEKWPRNLRTSPVKRSSDSSEFSGAARSRLFDTINLRGNSRGDVRTASDGGARGPPLGLPPQDKRAGVYGGRRGDGARDGRSAPIEFGRAAKHITQMGYEYDNKSAACLIE
jgi:hypothetical protein